MELGEREFGLLQHGARLRHATGSRAPVENIPLRLQADPPAVVGLPERVTRTLAHFPASKCGDVRERVRGRHRDRLFARSGELGQPLQLGTFGARGFERGDQVKRRRREFQRAEKHRQLVNLVREVGGEAERLAQ